jgi:hypothetical protein
MATKEEILSEIRSTARANGGVPLGAKRFSVNTGIKTAEVYKYWPRWSDALKEAGLPPNQLTAAREEDDLLGRLAAFVLELGHFPVRNEIDIRARELPGFPWCSTLMGRYGNRAALARALERFCRDRGQDDVAVICASMAASAKRKAIDEASSLRPVGYVYLIKHGSRKEYKIGRTNNPMRREGEIRTELPEMLSPIHQIETDDPAGIERYWHVRFSDRRKNGEWFALNADDVKAFKRWQRIY